MHKFLKNFVLISSAFIMSASVALYLSYQIGELKLTKRAPQEETTKRRVYKDAEGRPKYSNGGCQVDSECAPAGCSNHICSSDPSIITTCEFSEDFPNTKTHTCGCIENTCVWYQE